MKSFIILAVLTSVILKTHCNGDKKVNLSMVYKCCPINQVVGKGKKKVCMNPYKPINFISFPIFDYDYGADKTINDIFKIVPSKFLIDKSFHSDSISTLAPALRDYNLYLSKENIVGQPVPTVSILSASNLHPVPVTYGILKSIHRNKGILYQEMPNAYERWIKRDTNNFCIDLYMNQAGAVKALFWVKPLNKPEGKNDDFLSVAMLISSFFLLVVLIVYALLAELRNLCGLILMAYVASLLAALLLLALIRMKMHSNEICHGLTLAVYYFFLASFSWMNVMSFDIWWTFRTMNYAKALPNHRYRSVLLKFLVYCIYAWGLPLALTIMLVWVDTQDLTNRPWFVKPNLHSSCFIQGGEKFYYLYIPMLILISANWMFYLMTAFNIWRLSRETSILDCTPQAHRNHQQRFLVYLKLSIVMGLNWILEVVGSLSPGFFGWYITDLYNILTGFSIFLIFVCKRKILRKLAKLFYRTDSRNETSIRSTFKGSQETQSLQMCTNPNGPGYVVNNF